MGRPEMLKLRNRIDKLLKEKYGKEIGIESRQIEAVIEVFEGEMDHLVHRIGLVELEMNKKDGPH